MRIKHIGKNHHVRKTSWATPSTMVCRMSPNDIVHFCTVLAERNGVVLAVVIIKCRKRVQRTRAVAVVATALYVSVKKARRVFTKQLCYMYIF